MVMWWPTGSPSRWPCRQTGGEEQGGRAWHGTQERVAQCRLLCKPCQLSTACLTCIAQAATSTPRSQPPRLLGQRETEAAGVVSNDFLLRHPRLEQPALPQSRRVLLARLPLLPLRRCRGLLGRRLATRLEGRRGPFHLADQILCSIVAQEHACTFWSKGVSRTGRSRHRRCSCAAPHRPPTVHPPTQGHAAGVGGMDGIKLGAGVLACRTAGSGLIRCCVRPQPASLPHTNGQPAASSAGRPSRPCLRLPASHPPALERMALGPPGWASRNFVGSYTRPSRTNQHDSRLACCLICWGQGREERRGLGGHLNAQVGRRTAWDNLGR